MPRCRISSAPIGEAKTLTVLPAQVDVAPCNEIEYLLCLYCLDYLYVAGDLDLGVAAFTPLLLTFTSALLTFTLLLLTFTPAQFGRLPGSLNYSKKIRKKIRRGYEVLFSSEIMLRGLGKPRSDGYWEVQGSTIAVYSQNNSSSRRNTKYNFTYSELSTTALREAPSGSYIYLGCSCGSRRSSHEPNELREHNTTHGPCRDLMNARTKYL